ncbi:Golgin candidate 2 [Heracleum sosnowskyi]|uniref:Golgin candidate 2 n=1 Tax=Heracleum sosnowskyi TaxID=360622 RepID=A0AAD8JKY0_9APIA|nr:Golgin candidate 2 [Heracleum sosnowskyi]
MSGWISSKLKVAESLLQQIDQQAAESLGKNDKLQSDDLSYETRSKSNESVPLKDQLKKKKPEVKNSVGKLRNDRPLSVAHNKSLSGDGTVDRKGKDSVSTLHVKSKSTLTDSDWTELLSTPNKTASGSNGVSGARGFRNDTRKQSSSGTNLSSLVLRKGQNAQSKVIVNSPRKRDIVSDGKANGIGNLDGKLSGEDSRLSDLSPSVSTVDLHSDNETKDKKVVGTDASGSSIAGHMSEVVDEKNGKKSDSTYTTVDGSSHLPYESISSVLVPPAADGASVRASDSKMKIKDDHFKLGTAVRAIGKTSVGLRKSAYAERASSSGSDGASDSDTDSVSTTDSEIEREREERRKRREQILAQKAATKAVETIKERENKVARLEGEKQSLEKILQDRAKQQAQEASELQTTMMETMEAVDSEKLKHNSTRMEALARIAKLETENADLAKSLATSQRNLEVEASRVAEIRQQIEMKEVTHEEIRRKISSYQDGKKLVTSKGIEFEHEIIEAEYSFLTDKVARLQDKAKALETNIETTRKELEDPTEVEIELKRRLGQLTDHLIQKQAQVEGLSSEKAMLQFRIEAVSRMLEDNKSMLDSTGLPSTSSRSDLESGPWDLSNSKLRPMFENRLRSGKRHFSSLVYQLDHIFSAGAYFLRRNSAGKAWALVYLVCLHIWVLYILMSHSSVSEEERSGAVFSLENINNTGGI